MKGYVILLGVLYLATIARSVMALMGPPIGLVPYKAVIDIALFGLCLWGGYCFISGKTCLDADKWKLVSRVTLAVGGMLTIGLVWGTSLGLATPYPSPSLLQAAMLLLPYVLFAIPMILYANELGKERDGQ